MRTAGAEPPWMSACPTPSICDSFCCRISAAASYICGRLSTSLVRFRMKIGALAGFCLL